MPADPLKLAALFWPDVRFYKQQRQIIYSVADNNETFVPAGNMLGKDFVAAFIVLWYFLTRNPCRIVTTSAKDKHLDVLWGEINRFIQTSKYPLEEHNGGPLSIVHHEIRKNYQGKREPLSYVIGLVASPDTIASFQGHHIAKTGDGIPRTLFVGDEASSLRDAYYKMASTWADRMLVIGNPWPCENFFKYAVKGRPGTSDKGGDIHAPNNGHYYRKVIKIKAEDSPNVMLGQLQERHGIQPTDEIIIPGVKPYSEYLKNRLMWDSIQQCVSLDAEFYEGEETLLFPPEWLNRAEQLAAKLARQQRRAVTLGVDTAQGGDNTAWAVCDDLGLIKLTSMKTPDTAVIGPRTIATMREFNIAPHNVLFDAGGGGREHADYLRHQGFEGVRAIAFGAAASPEKKRRAMTPLEQRKIQDEIRYAYKNRRAEMYGLLRRRLSSVSGFGLPAEYHELRRQLAPIPLIYDGEGRMVLPPKSKRKPDSSEVCLTDIIGHSPDEADALALAVFGLERQSSGFTVRSMVKQ